MGPELFVLFADMLGFASLTEAHGASRDEFAAFDRPDTNEFLTMALEVDEASPLVASFVRFHVAVDDAVAFARKQGGSVTSITFSDSAFVATENFQTASTLAIFLMNELLPYGIMVRVGIASGSFVTLRFKADVSLNSGEHAAQFLGTGVVRSHAAAEKSGVSGARILLHPSIAFDTGDLRVMEEHAKRKAYYGPIRLPAEEIPNPLGIEFEINYLGRKDRKLYKGVHGASQVAPSAAAKHYTGTFRAMNRMRAALGRPSIPPELFGEDDEGS